MKTTITYLKDHPEHVPLLAEWAFKAWGHFNPNASVERAKTKLLEHLNDNQLPLAYVALSDNKPVGMCCLRTNDGIRADLTPWLGSLYVEPSLRSQGIGEQLIDAVLQKARSLGFPELYLLTFDETLPHWYKKLGWKLIGEDKLNGFPVSIMAFSLNTLI